MAEAQFSAVTVSADHTVINATETMVFVNLGTEEIVITLPAAVAGRMIVVGVSTHTSAPGTTNVVRVVPDPGIPTNKINGENAIVTWQLESALTFYGLGAPGWLAV